MKPLQKCRLLILAAVILACALRISRLERRPMHGDEAVHAVKFGQLLEEGFYRYDPDEYHGPTLNYLTLVSAVMSGRYQFAQLNEFTLRIVPVFFGVSLVLLFLLLPDGLGRTGAFVGAALTAVSPAFIFYSRYYIQEMLLVCFGFGLIACGYRYTRNRNFKWALSAGVFAGLCYATKETCVITFGAIAAALVLTFIWGRFSFSLARTARPLHVIAAAAAAIIVSALFYSSFLSNPTGVIDSVRSYTTYLNRAHSNALHIHPWYYYLKMLAYSKYGSGPLWSEGFIIALAVIGLIVALRAKTAVPMASQHIADPHLLRFLAFYALIMTAAYSAIPYKTPWCLLGFLHGMIVLAGVGAAALFRISAKASFRVLVGLLLAAGTLHLAWQGYLGSYRYYADTRNPYVYAHATEDVVRIADRIERVARVHPAGFQMVIHVICPGNDYWPLPWYLRRFPNVGWWNRVDEDVAAAPVVIASPSVETELTKKLYGLPPPGRKKLYVPLFDSYMELRPTVELRGYVLQELWDSYQHRMAELTAAGPTRVK